MLEASHLNEKGKGNFLAGMELIGRHNPIIASHLEDVSRYQQEGSWMNAHYPFPSSQNEFIRECGGVIRSAAVEEIQDAVYFTIIVDGTPDTSHTEQINFVIRFLLCKRRKLLLEYQRTILVYRSF